MELVTAAEIEEAAALLASVVRHTPVESSRPLHELVGGAVQSLNVPAVESRPDLSGPQGVHTHE